MGLRSEDGKERAVIYPRIPRARMVVTEGVTTMKWPRYGARQRQWTSEGGLRSAGTKVDDG